MAQQNVVVSAPSASFWTIWNIVAIVAAFLVLIVIVLYFLRDKEKNRIKANDDHCLHPFDYLRLRY